MNIDGYRRWYLGKLHLADQLVGKHGDAAELDAEILLCCATSALAAVMWPGDLIDKARFTQFLVKFASKASDVRKISIPVLVAKLRDKGDDASAQALIKAFYPNSDLRVLTGDEIDQPETVVTGLLPGLAIKGIRKSSYAAIIYVDLRCGLVHEYRLSTYLSSFGMSSAQNVPCYVNMEVEPDEAEVDRVAEQFEISKITARSAISRVVRHLHFPFPYIRDTLKAAAEAAFGYWKTASSWEQPQPSSWWIQG